MGVASDDQVTDSLLVKKDIESLEDVNVNDNNYKNKLAHSLFIILFITLIYFFVYTKYNIGITIPLIVLDLSLYVTIFDIIWISSIVYNIVFLRILFSSNKKMNPILLGIAPISLMFTAFYLFSQYSIHWTETNGIITDVKLIYAYLTN